MFLISVAVWTLFLIVGLPIIYVLALSILALTVPQRAIRSCSNTLRFAILVPAHNEQSNISDTLKSLTGIKYPKDRFEIIVIADNCSDGTAGVSRQIGATVLERSDSVLRGKGYALRWGFEQLFGSQKRHDAFVVVDADSVVSTNILSVFASSIERGARAIQCADLLRPQPGIWNIEVVRLGFFLHNYVRPLGRSVFRGHVGAMGNGMCFTREVLEKVPWNAYSQGEDLEYGLNLLLEGIPVEFAPTATVVASMPVNPRHAESQRSRWEMSRFPLIKKYAVPLLRSTWTQKSLRPIDALIELLTPAWVNLVGVAIIAALASFLGTALGWVPTLDGTIWLGVALLGGLHLLIGLILARDPSLWMTVVSIPRYAFWKLLLYLKLVNLGHTTEWIRTSRDS